MSDSCKAVAASRVADASVCGDWTANWWRARGSANVSAVVDRSRGCDNDVELVLSDGAHAVLRRPRKTVLPHAGHAARTQGWVNDMLAAAGGAGPRTLGACRDGAWIMETCVGVADADACDSVATHSGAVADLWRAVGGSLRCLHAAALLPWVHIVGCGVLESVAPTSDARGPGGRGWRVRARVEDRSWVEYFEGDLRANLDAAVGAGALTPAAHARALELWGAAARGAAARPPSLVHADVCGSNVRVGARGEFAGAH